MSTPRALPPEAHFILLCVRQADEIDPDDLQSAADAVDDWSRVVERATTHRVAAYVVEAAKRDSIDLPGAVIASLRATARNAVGRVLGLRSELERVVRAFATAGVPVIVLKGPALAQSVYPAPALRPYDDVDLTVRARDVTAAAAILCDAGFREISYGTAGPRTAHDGAAGTHGHDLSPSRVAGVRHQAFLAREFVLPSGEYHFELHTEPLQLGIEPACEAGRWARAVPLPGLSGALMLCPEDQLVQLSIHAHKHGFDRLIWLKDVDLLLRMYAEAMDWQLVAAVARREGVAASAWYCLRLTSTVLGTPTPAAGLEALQPAPLTRLLYSRMWPVRRIAALGGFRRSRSVQFLEDETWYGMIPNLLFMGRRRDRLRAALGALWQR